MNASLPTPEGVIRNPPTAPLIYGSLAVTFCLNILPWDGVALLARPDFLLLAILYWSMEEPRQVGAFSAFCGGLLMDIAEGWFLGQNALVYSLAAWLAVTFRSRILTFGWGSQALHVFLFLALGQGLIALLHLTLGSVFPGSAWLLRAPLGAAAWPLLCWALEQPRLQVRREEAP